ncbi:MAG: protein translocase subunit SecD, partial [Bdellovibrionota bacterium]
MSRSWWMRLSLLVFLIVVAFIYVFPTVANLNLETTRFPYKKKVNLGLDLQGGLYMVYGVDFKKVYQDKLVRAVDSLNAELNKAGVNGKVGKPDSSIEEDPKVHLTFDAAMAAKIDEQLEKQKYTLRATNKANGDYEIAMARDYRATLKENTLSQSLQVIRSRIDEFGVSEPSIVTKGNNQIVVELPGVKDVERAKALVGRTARLEFKMVNMEHSRELPVLLATAEKEKGISYKEGEKFSEYLTKINAALKGKIPEDSEVLFERKPGNVNIPYLIYTKVELTGAELVDANVGFDQQTQTPEVDFVLSPRGAVTFGDLTRASVGKNLAIVLDDVIYSAPRINSPIPGGRGMITVGGSGDQGFKDARDLAIVLRAGALPAQLDLLEQRVIGPSIGADSIHRGLTASMVGCSLIFLFMAFYYRASGLVAVISLILNGMFTFAVLIGIDATLTLPGIAGLALTIGMAVDSNVIIFERIRDELTEGKSVVGAVQSGFDKAFSCIFDANITHAIVAVILLNFGSGPIRGFAVTL